MERVVVHVAAPWLFTLSMENRLKEGNILRRFGLLSFALPVLAAVSTAGCRGGADAGKAVLPNEVDLLDTSLGLPTDATGINIHEEGRSDRYQAIRFDTGMANARVFVTKLTGTAPHSGTWMLGGLDENWWVKGDMQHAEGAEATTPKGSITVILQPLPHGRARVWLEIFEV